MPQSTNIRWTELNVDWNDVKYQVDNAPHGTKTTVKKRIARQLGISIHQLHSALRETFGAAKKIEREPEIDRKLIYTIAEMKITSMRMGSGERKLPTWRCIEILQDLDVEGAQSLTKSTVDRVLREEFGMNQPTPRTRWEPEYALQEIQVDYSPSKYFKPAKTSDLKKAGSSVRLDQEDSDEPMLVATNRVLSYKENDVRRRLMLGVVMDTYSRVRYHSGYICAGESALNSIEFLSNFFRREDDELVFRHLGWNFRIDNGPLYSSQMGQSFFKAIDRPVENTVPYGKTGLGKAERGWQLVWSWEQDLAMRIGPGGTISLREYNELLLQECIRQQYEMHPYRSNQRRIDMYQQSVLKQDPRPQVIDVDLTKIVFTSLERKVGDDQLISIDNEKYIVPVYAGEEYTTGRWIRIIKNKDGKMIGELRDRVSESFEILPEARSKRGDFNSHKQTTPQRINADLDEGRSIMDQIRERKERTLPRTAQGPQRLMPKSQPADINSPFAEKENPNTETPKHPNTFNSKFEAMHHVGQLLSQQGIALEDDLHGYFEDYVIQCGLNQADITNQVNAFITELQTQTGT